MTITITKISVKLVQDKLYSIILNMKYLDGEVVLIDQNFTQRYRTGDNVGVIVNKFKVVMQKVIDDYKAEQVIFTASSLNTAITTLQSGLIT